MYHFRRFNPKMISDDKVIAISARRGSGKTSLMTDLLYYKRNIPAGIVISATECGNSHYANYVPGSFIYNEYNDDVVNRLITRQKKLLSEKAENANVFLVLDDIAYDKTVFKKESIRYLFMNGRHLKILLIMSMQFSLDLPPALRSNIDYFFVFADNNATNQKRLYDHFFGMFPSFPSFQTAFQELTKDYGCMVLDNTVPSAKVEDCVFHFKAELRKPYRIGAPEYWKYNGDPKEKDKESDGEKRKTKTKSSKR